MLSAIAMAESLVFLTDREKGTQHLPSGRDNARGSERSGEPPEPALRRKEARSVTELWHFRVIAASDI
jgi:hypothetical protein